MKMNCLKVSSLYLNKNILKILIPNSFFNIKCTKFSVLSDKSCNSIVKKNLYYLPLHQSIRWRAPKISKLRGTLGIKRSKIRGIFCDDGDWVSAGTILVKQLGLQYLPGLNVGLGRNMNLFAMEHGEVVITTEKFNPNWDMKPVQTYFGQYANKDIQIYKTYFHVIAKEMPKKFNLVDQV